MIRPEITDCCEWAIKDCCRAEQMRTERAMSRMVIIDEVLEVDWDRVLAKPGRSVGIDIQADRVSAVVMLDGAQA